MKISAGNNRGIALIITLTAITIIIAVALELNRQMRKSVMSAATTKNQMSLSHMVHSGVSVGMAALSMDKTDSANVSVQDDWADSEMIEHYLAQLPLENGNIRLEITDERSRLQLNALVSFPEGRDFNPHQLRLWQRFFTLMFAGAQEESAGFNFDTGNITPEMIINPVKDWLDSGDDDAITGLTGAEEDHYRMLDQPYSCRNGPFKHALELIRVKNITREMFYSFDIGNYVTVYGMTPSGEDGHRFTYDGKININTAEMPVVAALLPEGYEFLAEEIVAYREESADDEYIHDLTDPNWYKSVPGAEEIEIQPDLITTQSDHFRIVCSAEQDGIIVQATVIVLREKDEDSGRWHCRPLSWSYQDI
ncbi:MAG: type II secretion system protein GspK [Desulfosalsimonadaceae bacterium]